MESIICSPQLLEHLRTIHVLTRQFVKIEEDKSYEQLTEEIQILKDLLDQTLSLVKKERSV